MVRMLIIALLVVALILVLYSSNIDRNKKEPLKGSIRNLLEINKRINNQ